MFFTNNATRYETILSGAGERRAADNRGNPFTRPISRYDCRRETPFVIIIV